METGKCPKKATNIEECKVMRERCAELYQKLYEDTVQNTTKRETEEGSSILTSELERAFSQIKSTKAPGEDEIVVETIRAGGRVRSEKDPTAFQCRSKTRNSALVPKEWQNVIITRILKKGDNKHLANCRPISLLSHIYIIFMKAINNKTQQYTR